LFVINVGSVLRAIKGSLLTRFSKAAIQLRKHSSSTQKAISVDKNETNQEHFSKAVKDFMLAEYRALDNARASSLQRGQAYISLFLTIVSGTAALLALMSQLASNTESFFFISLSILFLLFLLGLISFARVLQRDLGIIRISRGLNRIRRYFVEIEPDIQPYLTYPPCDDKPEYTHTGISRIGLRSIVALINSSTGATLAYLVASAGFENSRIAWISVVIAVVVFVISLVLHELYVSSRLRAAESKAEVRFPSGGGHESIGEMLDESA
jgi:hypothetical protein